MSGSILNRSVFRHTWFALAALVATCVVVVPWSSQAACPEQRPHMEACIEFGASCGDATGWEACEALTDISIWNGWFGCEASPHQTQCLVGQSTDQTTCYTECVCYVDYWTYEDPFCAKDHRDCARHFRIIKVTKDCPLQT